MADLKIYDENAALNHVKSLEFKRLAGSEGETKTLNYIQRELEKESISSTLESFEWAKTTVYLMKLAFLFILFYVIIYQIILMYTEFIWIILLLDVLLVGIIYFGMKVLFDMTRVSYIGKKSESQNVISKVPSKNPKLKKPLIIFSAHYDSISVKYSYKKQLLLYITAGLLALLYLIVTFILSIWGALTVLNLVSINIIFEIIRVFSLIVGSILSIFTLLIVLNKRTNESTGAIDNATGVAILIEMAKLLNKNPLNNIDVLFLWCGAEEWGLWGSKQFCSQHFDDLEDEYDLDQSYNINLDMVGTYIGLVDSTGLIKKKKMKLKPSRLRKAQDQINRIMNKDVLSNLQTESKKYFNQKQDLLSSGTINECKGEKTELLDCIKNLETKKQLLEAKDNRLDKENKDAKKRAIENKTELETLLSTITGIKVSIVFE